MTAKHYSELVAKIASQEGKVVAITGTTSGTGFIAARTAAQKGAEVVLLNRESTRSQKALELLKKAVPEAVFVPITCDLHDFESVKHAAEELTSKYGESGIDVLCNNAGIMASEDKATKDGYDIQIQTNYLSHFLLSSLVYPLLKKAAESKGEARIVNHSSLARTNFSAAALEAKYLEQKGGNLGGNGNSYFFKSSGGRNFRYQQSKLAISVFTFELNKRLQAANSKVKVFCAEPGLSATGILDPASPDGHVSGFASFVLSKLAQPMEDGTCGILTGMFVQDAVPGSLYGPGKFKGPASIQDHGPATNDAAGKLLWEKSEEACGAFAEL